MDSEHDRCCSTVIISGLSNTVFLGHYIFDKTLINGRPLYVEESETNGLWFDGQSGWVIGLLSDLKKGKVTYTNVRSNEDTNCPTLTSLSKEYFDEEWKNNKENRLECLDQNSDQIWTWTDDRTCNSNFQTWTDDRGFSCQHYSDKDWCTLEGKYGPNWKDQGFFPQFAKDGLSASNCPQCGCEIEYKRYCNCDDCACKGDNYQLKA